MTVDSACPQLHNHAAQIPVLSVEGAAPVALKREGTATEHVFKIHIGSASGSGGLSGGLDAAGGGKVHEAHLYVCPYGPGWPR